MSSGAAMQPGFKEEFCLLRPWGQDPGSILAVAVVVMQAFHANWPQLILESKCGNMTKS